MPIALCLALVLTGAKATLSYTFEEKRSLDAPQSSERCSACSGPYHPSTGHAFTPTCQLCGPCARHMNGWVKGHTARRWGKQKFYEHAATSVKPAA